MTESLLLDEMHAPIVAVELRKRGHDVIAVADNAELRGMSDDELFRWAGVQHRRIVTENVKDFRPMLLRSAESDRNATAVLLPAVVRFRDRTATSANSFTPWMNGSDRVQRTPSRIGSARPCARSILRFRNHTAPPSV